MHMLWELFWNIKQSSKMNDASPVGTVKFPQMGNHVADSLSHDLEWMEWCSQWDM